MFFKYLWYLIRHKWYVMIECFKLGQYWRGITHDLSKLRPSEFIPYMRYFYGNYPSFEIIKRHPEFTGYLTKEQVERDFDEAWLKHIHRNPHHWQHWILREDSGKIKVLNMPEKYILEMIADWHGAGMAITGKKNTKEWYLKNRDKMQLSPFTKESVEIMLGFLLD